MTCHYDTHKSDVYTSVICLQAGTVIILTLFEDSIEEPPESIHWTVSQTVPWNTALRAIIFRRL